MDNPNPTMKKTRLGIIDVCVSDRGGAEGVLTDADISIFAESTIEDCSTFHPDTWERKEHTLVDTKRTGNTGCVTFPDLQPGVYVVTYDHYPETQPQCVMVKAGCTVDVCFKLDLSASHRISFLDEDCEPIPCKQPRVCDHVNVVAEFKDSVKLKNIVSNAVLTPGFKTDPDNKFSFTGVINKAGLQTISSELRFPRMGSQAFTSPSVNSTESMAPGGVARLRLETEVDAVDRIPQPIGGNIGVQLRRTASQPTRDQALWVAIRNRTKAISFSGSGYKDFIDRVLCRRERETPPSKVLTRQLDELGSHVYGVGAFELLKTATEVFLLLECGVAINPTGAHDDDELFKADEESNRLGAPVGLEEIQDRLTQYLGQGRLPYISRVLNAAFPGEEVGNVHCVGVLTSKVDGPCLLELIWSYWHEEGMLVQTINAVSRRFQNVRGPGDRDPLAHLEIDPLRPLNNLLWGYLQDEQNRLSVKRRTYEYDHHYGLTLYGKAVPTLRSADSRSKFLEGFHNLLHLCSVFFKEDNDTTVIADGFPLLNALKEVHLILAQGAHNQFGDLPWTARVEMLIQEWLLARPEMRDFLQSRAMVPYKEGWMPQVDTMKTMQGWTDVTVTHFRDLGVYGEQILLSIRYGDWIDINDEDSAKNWARYWRPEIQGYLHAYRAAVGVDLTNPDMVDYTLPAIHLQKRMATQHGRA